MASPRAVLSSEQPAVTAAEMTFVKLHDKLGARVEGVDLRRPLAPDAVELLNAKLVETDLLLFPGQDLSPEDELRLYQYLPHDAGALAEGSRVQKLGPKLPGVPAIAVRGHNMELRDHYGLTCDEPLKYSDAFRDTLVWHMDAIGLTATPPEVSGMYMLEAPSSGGDTLFASMADLYESVVAASPEKEAELKALTCEYARATFLFTRTSEDGIGRADDMEAALEQVKSNPALAALVGDDVPTPFVVVDPRTGTTNFLISPNTFYTWGDRPSAESRAALQEMFCPYLQDPANVMTLKWAPGDLAVWRNRRLLHTSTPWKDYPDEKRLFHLMFLDSAEPLVAPPP